MGLARQEAYVNGHEPLMVICTARQLMSGVEDSVPKHNTKVSTENEPKERS